MKRLQVILAARDRDDLAGVATTLEADQRFTVQWHHTAETALQAVENTPVEVVIAASDLRDASGLELISAVVAANPFINSALVSSQSARDFHESTEGLGIFCQLPVNPGEDDARRMIELLDRIYQL